MNTQPHTHLAMHTLTHTCARIGTLSLALLAAGCTTLGPDHQRPATALPAQFPGATAPSASSAPAAPTAQLASAAAALSSDWWTLYRSPELTRLVEQALAANADIAQAAARVQQADSVLREADGAFMPTVNANSSAGRSALGASVPSNASGRTVTGNDFKLGLSTSFELDFWGQLSRASEGARAQLLASTAARDTVRLTVAGSVAQAWFALRSLDAQIAQTRGVLRSRVDGAKLVQARLQAGSASRLEAEQAETLRADAAINLRELQRQRATTLSLLGVLAAQPGLQLPEVSLNVLPPPAPDTGLPSDLLERRPDVQRAEALLVAANAQIGVARAAVFPKLMLTGAGGLESAALNTLLKGPAQIWSLGLGLTAPLFDGGRSAARVDQAAARQREALAAYQGTVANAFKEVADALANARAARDSQADTESQRDAAEQALRLAQARYSAGYTGHLDWLEAQRTAAAARLAVVRNQQAQLQASVDLMKALGGGWKP